MGSTEDLKLFCLEAVRDASKTNDSKLFPMLEHLAFEHGITNVYQTCDSITSFEQSLNNLLYEDRNFMDYELIYLVVKGTGEDIVIDGYRYSLQEIAELFEGKLKGKIIHFANTKTLDIDLETAQYFIDITRAKALSGYVEETIFDSTFLDSKLIAHFYQDTDDPEALVKLLLENQNKLAHALGFRLFY
ncbi:hypothetical protein HUK80_06720 [Flavobacterium sp. MAH-1]|uniref:Uncharacterized protein n=1 Tax=Flavobacterium agri TaxID=2743471 RepID=A0A7Y9C551_9FLAO|nr:DUF6642 family protein [Flavobacterium agri]NUY80581.1 hypothetical protein [Flavobacterium agri]NYA70605.1 hypothetical protein [Flavobacterium agri]